MVPEDARWFGVLECSWSGECCEHTSGSRLWGSAVGAPAYFIYRKKVITGLSASARSGRRLGLEKC